MPSSPAPTWAGPVARPVSLRPVVVGVLVVALVVGCLLPSASRGPRTVAVLAGLAVTLIVAAWPRPPARPRWRIDPTGVTTWDPTGATDHVPADRYDAVAFDTGPATDAEGRALTGSRPDRFLLVRTGGASTGGASTGGESTGEVVHDVPLERVGTAFTACLVARSLGLQLLLPPPGRTAVITAEERLHDALTAPAPVATTAADDVLTDRRGGGPTRAVVLRVLTGLVGVLLVMTLATTVGETVTGRLGGAFGVLLAVAALPRLARGRAVRSTLRWRVTGDGLQVDDTDRRPHRVRAEDLGAVVLTLAELSGHGARPIRFALVVDPAGRPRVELPLGAIDPALLGEALRGHGVRVVRAEVPPWEVRGGLSRSG